MPRDTGKISNIMNDVCEGTANFKSLNSTTLSICFGGSKAFLLCTLKSLRTIIGAERYREMSYSLDDEPL